MATVEISTQKSTALQNGPFCCCQHNSKERHGSFIFALAGKQKADFWLRGFEGGMLWGKVELLMEVRGQECPHPLRTENLRFSPCLSSSYLVIWTFVGPASSMNMSAGQQTLQLPYKKILADCCEPGPEPAAENICFATARAQKENFKLTTRGRAVHTLQEAIRSQKAKE